MEARGGGAEYHCVDDFGPEGDGGGRVAACVCGGDRKSVV